MAAASGTKPSTAIYCGLVKQKTTQAFGFKGHRGRDSRALVPTPVYGSGDGIGIVTRVDYGDPIYGYEVTTRYYLTTGDFLDVMDGHLSAVFVKKGDLVYLSTVLGETGGEPGAPGAGISKGPHLHEGCWFNGTLVNPDNVLNPRSTIPAGGGTVPIGEEDMPIKYIATSNNPSVTVGKDDLWGRPFMGAPLRRLTSGQAGEYPGDPIPKPGAWFDAAFEEDRVVYGYNVLTHPWEVQGGDSADLTPVLEAIAKVPTAKQNGAAARIAIVK